MSYGQHNATSYHRSPCNGKTFKCVDSTHYRQCHVIAKVDNQTMSALDSKVKACGPGRTCNARNKSPCVLRNVIKKPTTPNKGGGQGSKPQKDPQGKPPGNNNVSQTKPQQTHVNHQMKPSNVNQMKPAQNRPQQNTPPSNNITIPMKDQGNEIDSEIIKVPPTNNTGSSLLGISSDEDESDGEIEEIGTYK